MLLQSTGVLLALLWQVAMPVPALCQQGALPDRACSPGSTNPNVTQENIHQTICVPGWSARQRPPVSLTNQWKRQAMVNYGYAASEIRNLEGDHVVPIEAGGNPGAYLVNGRWQPASPLTNFWPEAWTRDDGLGARAKDLTENAIRRSICSGELTLDEGQRAIAVDWVAIYRARVAP